MAERLAPGSLFGGYEIVGEIGAGGMGVVYRARDPTLERDVAVKTLSAEFAKDPEFVQRFLREARSVARLSHPNIVQIYNFGCVEGTYYLAMEYLDGRSLAVYLKNGPWPEREALGLARQACRALAVAHAEGIVHRDIKPDNLILTKRGVLKLVDLGIAKRVTEDQGITQTGHAVGTPNYISPEQIRGQKDIDARADIYSLGATLYHLVTGRAPFAGSSGAHVMSMHLFQPLPDPRAYVRSLSEGLCQVLTKAMAKERDERYADIAGFDAELERLERGESPQEANEGDPMGGSTILLQAPGTTALLGGVVASEPAGFDPALLAKIEENLTTSIGPMARVVVRQTARRAPDLESLCSELARQLDPGADRDAFCKKCLACGEGQPRTSGSRAAVSTPGRSRALSQPASPARSGARSATAGAPPPPPPPAVTGAGATGRPLGWTDADLALLEAELARQIGPLAKVLVRKAAKRAAHRDDLVAALLESIPEEPSRRAFLAALRGKL